MSIVADVDKDPRYWSVYTTTTKQRSMFYGKWICLKIPIIGKCFAKDGIFKTAEEALKKIAEAAK